MPDNKKQGRSNKAMTFFVCFLAALAGLLFGLDIGVIAGALPFITDEFQITAHTQEWVVSSMMFGAAVGAVGSGWLSFKLGRKKSLMIGAILFVAGSLFSAAAPNVEVLIISRVLLGLAVGVASYTAPLYLSEIAPEKIRGSMISMYQLMITIGGSGRLSVRYRVQLQRRMALDARRDHHPGHSAVDRRLLLAGQPALVCGETPFP